MQLIYEIVFEMWRILLDSSPYILFGIIAAGMIKMYLNESFVARHLGRNRYASVVKASLFGVPLPL